MKINIKTKTLVRKFAILMGTLLFAHFALANPVLNNISSGNISVQQNSNTTTVNQTSQRGIINWRTFNIHSNEATHFQQPKGGVTLNRIDGTQGVSQIYGRLTATGQIILVNPAGIYFGPTAYVNVGGLIATTADIRDDDFLNGNYHFSKPSPYAGAIVNDGYIVARENGLVALVAPGVINNGRIEANLGKVVLGSGETFTLNFSGDNLINFSIDTPTSRRGVDKDGNEIRDGVRNTGSLIANGGTVIVSAKAVRGVLDNVINMQGIAQAKSVGVINGQIILSGDVNGGNVRIAGKLIASGKGSSEKGGNIVVTGHTIQVESPTEIDVSGDTGGGNIFIGGSFQGKGPLPNASVTTIGSNVKILADAVTHGAGGNIIVWGDSAQISGEFSARGGSLSGDGGFVETSGHYLDVNNIQSVDLRAPAGKTGIWLLDPTTIYIANDLATAILAGMTGVDTSADTGTGGDPNTFQASGIVADSLLTVGNLQTALASANVVVTTNNASGIGTGDINLVNPVTWANSNTLTLFADHDINLNSTITAASGTLTLQAGNAISATVANAANALNLNIVSGAYTNNAAVANSIGSTTNLNLSSGASINLNGQNQTFNSLTGSGTITNTGAAAVLARTATTSATTTFSGSITGNLSLTVDGGVVASNSLLILSGSNTYNGGTNISGGGLSITNVNALGSGAISITAGGTLELNFASSVTLANSANITLSSNGTPGGGFPGFAVVGGLRSVGGGIVTLNNNINITGSSILRPVLAGMILNGDLSGSAAVTVSGVGNGGLILNGGGTYSGALSVTDGSFFTISNLASVANVPSITFTNASGGGLIINSAANGSLNASVINLVNANNFFRNISAGNITVNSAIGGNGSVVQLGSGTLTLNTTNTYAGSTTVSTGILNAATASSLGSGTIFVTSGASLQLGFNGALGNTSNITLNGNGVGGLGALQAIGTNISLTNAILLGSSTTIGGTGSFTALGAITDSGSSDLTFNFPTAGVAIQLPAITLGTGGDLSVTTTGGAITQGGALIIPGTSSFNAGASTITLNNGSNNLAGAIGLQNTGLLNDVSLTNSVATILATSSIGRSLTINSSGAISQTGNLIYSNTLTLNAVGGITLPSVFTTNGALSVSNTTSGNITLSVSASLVNLIGMTQTANANFTLINPAGNIFITTPVSVPALGSGNITFGTGGATNSIDIFANITGSATGYVALNSIHRTTQNAGVITAPGGLRATGNSGPLGVINLNGNNNISSFAGQTTGGFITLNNGTNPLTIGTINGLSGINSSGGNITITSGSLNITQGINSGAGSLTITANGSITQSAALLIGGTTSLSLTAAASDVLLNSAANNFGGAITFSGTLSNVRDLGLRNINVAAALPTNITSLSNLRNLGLTFNNSAMNFPSLTLTSGGSLTAVAGGAITQSGVLTVPGTSSFTTGNFAITLNSANNLAGAISLNNTGANNVSLTNAIAVILGASNLGSGTLAITANIGAGSSITQTAPILLASGSTASFNSNSDITLSLANDFSNVIVTNATNVSLTDTNAMNVSGITASGVVSLTANSLTDSAAISAPTLNLNTATGATLDFGHVVNVFSATNSTSGDIIFNNNTALSIAGITQSAGNLTLTTGGALTQTGAMTISGTSTITTTGSMTLTNGSNAFNGMVTLTANGALSDANLTNSISLTTGKITVGRNVTLMTTGGNIFLSGAIDPVNVSILSAGTITQAAAGLITASNLLTTTSVGGTTLDGLNQVASVNLSNTGGGNIVFNNQTSSLAIQGVSNPVGSTTINNNGGINIVGALNSVGIIVAATGALNLAANITSNAVGDAIQLATGTAFTYTSGTLSTPSGQWLIWSVNPASDTNVSSLPSHFVQFDSFFNYSNPSASTPRTQSGNGLLYQISSPLPPVPPVPPAPPVSPIDVSPILQVPVISGPPSDATSGTSGLDESIQKIWDEFDRVRVRINPYCSSM